MSATPSFITAAIKLSVPMNGVLVPFNRSVENLQRFCRPVMFHNDDPIFDLSCSGSSLLIRHAGRNLMLFTRHQITNQQRNPNEVVLIVDESNHQKVALTPNEATRVVPQTPEQAGLDDIIILEYASERNGRDLQAQFYSLDLESTADLRSVPPDRVVLIFTIGYPTRFSSFDTTIDEADGSATGLDVVSRWVKLYLEPVERNSWDHKDRIPLQVDHRYKVDIGDPDGFSGSPVFFLYQDDSKQAFLGFAGLVTHANQAGRFNIYETRNIRQIVSKVAATKN